MATVLMFAKLPLIHWIWARVEIGKIGILRISQIRDCMRGSNLAGSVVGPPSVTGEACCVAEVGGSGFQLAVMGVPGRAMLVESNSRNTHDNALYTAVVLNNKHVQRILLVTSAYHMRRAQPLFEKQGFEVIAAPTDYQRLVSSRVLPPLLPTVDELSRSTIAIKEHVGYWVYRWRGWI